MNTVIDHRTNKHDIRRFRARRNALQNIKGLDRFYPAAVCQLSRCDLWYLKTWTVHCHRPTADCMCGKICMMTVENLFHFSRNNSPLPLPPSYSFSIHARRMWFHKLANHVKELWPWRWKTDMNIFRVLLVCFRGVLVSCFWAFVPVNLFLLCLEFGIFILAKCCCSFNKFNTYFPRSLDSSLLQILRSWKD